MAPSEKLSDWPARGTEPRSDTPQGSFFERSHPGPGFLDERPRAEDAHAFARTEVSNVVRDQESRTGSDRRCQDRDVLRVRQRARSVAITRSGTVDLNCDRAEECFEQWSGLGELSGQVPANFCDGDLGQYQTQEADFTEDQDRMAGAGA